MVDGRYKMLFYKHIMDRIIHRGYDCCIFGGAVRDTILGVEPSDCDIVVDFGIHLRRRKDPSMDSVLHAFNDIFTCFPTATRILDKYGMYVIKLRLMFCKLEIDCDIVLVAMLTNLSYPSIDFDVNQLCVSDSFLTQKCHHIDGITTIGEFSRVVKETHNMIVDQESHIYEQIEDTIASIKQKTCKCLMFDRVDRHPDYESVGRKVFRVIEPFYMKNIGFRVMKMMAKGFTISNIAKYPANIPVLIV